jgi:glycerol-3-phosphate acyltransferase PlsY
MEMASVFVALGFVSGSLPLSLWAGRLLRRADVREFGDGNPGAANAWRAGGWRLGVPAMLLDYLKGAVPVALAYFAAGVGGWSLVPVALAPVLGSAFSPILRFRGGKSVAVTFGVWTGLTLGQGPLVLGLFLGFLTAVQAADAWTVVLALLGLLAHLVSVGAGPVLLAICVGNLAVLVWTHRHGLSEPIRPRGWVSDLLRRSG